jgi:hypothetical protein
MVGSSPWAGSGQFGNNARVYRKKFLRKVDAMLEIMESTYEVGSRGFHGVPIGKMAEAAKIMVETHEDYVVVGSCFPEPNSMLEEVIKMDPKIIFLHATISDKKDSALLRMVDEVSSRGFIPGIAVHNPVPTLKFSLENAKNVKCFLVPFNPRGFMMGKRKELEELVDSNLDKAFFGMKTLVAGKLKPEKAYEYITQHNICSIVIGQVDVEEAKASTKVALNALQNK